MATSDGATTRIGQQSFEANALSLLNSVWKELEDIPLDAVPTGQISQAVWAVLQHHEIGWKYSIVIQIVGKAAKFELDALCLQKGDGQLGMWDPREFGRAVVVEWNKSIGSPLGNSGDPYVNNMFRNPRFNEAMRNARRSQTIFDTVKGILDTVQASTTPEQVRDHLKMLLAQLRKYLNGKTFDYAIPQRVSLDDALTCVTQYVNVSSGGTRLQAVAQGLVMALEKKGLRYGEVRAGHVNAADTASNSSGDVECFVEGVNVLTIEVKDRELTKAEVESSVDKARLGNVKELLFFVHRLPASTVAQADQETVQKIIQNQFSLGLNIYVESALACIKHSATLLGEDGRKIFLESVGVALRLQAADPQHRWAWSKAVSNIGAVVG